MNISAAAATAAIAAIAARVDSGAGAGRIRIYTGTRPAGPGTTTAETLLAEFTCSDPAFVAGAAGVQNLDVTPALTDTGIADGTAGWARFVDSAAGAGAAGELDLTAGTSGTELILNTATISVGVNVEILSGSITQPTS